MHVLLNLKFRIKIMKYIRQNKLQWGIATYYPNRYENIDSLFIETDLEKSIIVIIHNKIVETN